LILLLFFANVLDGKGDKLSWILVPREEKVGAEGDEIGDEEPEMVTETTHRIVIGKPSGAIANAASSGEKSDKAKPGA
jgi:hypothetical protein